MPAAKAQVTLRGLRIAKCKRAPELVGRVFTWEDLRVRRHREGGTSFLIKPIDEKDPRAIGGSLSYSQSRIIKRLRERATLRDARAGTLRLETSPTDIAKRGSETLQTALMSALLIGGAVAVYMKLVHLPHGWPPIGPGATSPLYDALDALGKAGMVSLFGLISVLLSIQLVIRPRLVALSPEGVSIVGGWNRRINIPLSEIRSAILPSLGRAQLKLQDGRRLTVHYRQPFSPASIVALGPLSGGTIDILDDRHRMFRLGIRAVLVFVPICLLIAGVMLFSNVAFLTRDIVLVALIPMAFTVLVGLPFGMMRAAGWMETWWRKRSRAKGRTVT